MTIDAIVPESPFFRKLSKATKPAETKKIESASAAAQAWAKEEGDYEAYVGATYAYVLARRKTTELLKPFIKQGGNRQGNMNVTLMEKTGFTKQQWHRRVKELEVPVELLDEYFNECISNGWHPSLAGVLRYSKSGDLPPSAPQAHELTCPNCGAVIKK